MYCCTRWGRRVQNATVLGDRWGSLSLDRSHSNSARADIYRTISFPAISRDSVRFAPPIEIVTLSAAGSLATSEPLVPISSPACDRNRKKSGD